MFTRIKIIVISMTLLVGLFVLTACDGTHTHQFEDWVTTKAATCTEAGEEIRYCSCGDSQTRVIAAKDHNYEGWVITKAPTCTEPGEESSLCACGDALTLTIFAKEHSYGAWIVTKASTCTEAGVEERYCSCGDKQTKPIASGHSYSDWIVAEEPTCAKTGSKYKACSSCDDVITEVLPKTSTHVYTDVEVTKEPTCIKEGSKNVVCTLCGNESTEVVPPLKHDLDENGKCSRCGVTSMNMTDEEITKSQKVKTISYSVSEALSNKIRIKISFKDSSGHTVQAPAYVDVKIVDDEGNIAYSKTLVKLSSQSSVDIDHSEIINAYTSTGTIYYTVYNEYFEFDTISAYLEDLPWMVDVELPELPQTIFYHAYNKPNTSSCIVTSITYKISGKSVTFYFSGEKTYDIEGDNYNRTCYISWKLYDEEGYVVDNGTCFTTSIQVGEKFKDASVSAHGVIEEGKSYRLVIMDCE